MALAADSKSAYIPLSTIFGKKSADGQYALSALDLKNLNDNLWSIVKKIQGNLTLSDLTSLAVDELRAGTVISNTTITNNLYSVFGDIAELTVDRLLTSDKIGRYQDYDTSDINYIWIQDQYIKFMTGTTDGATVQHTDRNGNPLYWYDASMTGMSTTPTAYPVIVFQYEELVKLQLAFESDGEYYVPKILLGAGDGIKDKSGKGEIYKSNGGLVINYYASNTAELRQIKLNDTGIEMTPAFILFPDTENDTAIAATEETVLPGINVTFYPGVTRVAFDIMIDITASEAMDITVTARVDGEVHRQTVKHFTGAYTDGLAFHGVFDPVLEGKRLVDFTITPSTGTASIAIGGYRAMLTVRNGAAEEAAPYPYIKVEDTIKIKPFKPVDSVTTAAQIPTPLVISDNIAIPTLFDSVEITLT
jgi:hypothetical protein